MKKDNYDSIINTGIPNDIGILLSYDSLRFLWKDEKSSIEFSNKLKELFDDFKLEYGLDDSIYMNYFFEIVIQSINGKKVIKLSEESIIGTLFRFFNLDYKLNTNYNLSYQEKEKELNENIEILKKFIREKIRELEKVDDIEQLKDISYELYLSYENALNESPQKKDDPTWQLFFITELKKDIAKFKRFNIWLKEFIKDICEPLDENLFKNIDSDKLRLFLAKQYLEVIKNNPHDNILILDYINRTIEDLSNKKTVITNQFFLTTDNVFPQHNSLLNIDKYTVEMLQNEFISLLNKNQTLKEQLDILFKFNKNDFDNLSVPEVKEYVDLILENIHDNWKNIDKNEIETELSNLESLAKNSDNHDINKVKLLIEKLKFLLEHKPTRVIEGEGTFKGYYGFIYPNGKIILESLYEDNNKKKISYGNAIYQMDLKTFKEKGNLSKTELFSHDKNIRIIHQEGWKNKLEAILNEKSASNIVLELKEVDLNSILSLEDLAIITSKLEELEKRVPSAEIDKEKKKLKTRKKEIIVDKINRDLEENPSENYSLISDRDKFIQMVNEIGNSISKSNFIDFFDEYYKNFAYKVKANKAKRNPAIASYTKKRANNTCDCCGEQYDSIRMFDSHHLIPLSKGGPDNIYNTVCLCPRCHRIAHSDGFTNNQLYILTEKIRNYLKKDSLNEYLNKFDALFLPYKDILEQEKFFMEWNGYYKSK